MDTEKAEGTHFLRYTMAVKAALLNAANHLASSPLPLSNALALSWAHYKVVTLLRTLSRDLEDEKYLRDLYFAPGVSCVPFASCYG